MPNGFQDYLLGLPKEEFDSLYQKFTAAKPEPFSGARKKTYGTMGIATPQDVQFAERAKEVAPNLLESAANTVAAFAPGSGEYISARQSTEDVAKAREAINNGDYASAAAHGLESVVNAVGSIPIAHQIMALGKGAVGVAKGLMGAEHIIPAITTYHGSPTSGIRKWDLNFRGTGEGGLPIDSPARESFTDMIGHGLYSAEKEGIAKGYQERLAKNNLKDLSEAFSQSFPGGEAIIDRIHYPNAKSLSEAVEKGYVDASKLPVPFRNALSKGSLYTTELTPHPDEFLLWDKPLSEQSEKVKEQLKAATDLPKIRAFLGGMRGTSFVDAANMQYFDGKDFYQEMQASLGSDKAASEYLHSLGIRGIKYEDGNTRGKSGWQMVATKNGKVISDKNFATRELAEQAGKDLQGGVSGVTYDVKETASYNYVTFNPAEEAIITHENGKRIPGAVEEAYRKLRDPKSKALFEKRYPELKGE